MKHWLLLLIPLAFLFGCSSTMVIPGEKVIDSSGKIITTTAETVGDTSSYRTHEKYRAWNIANQEYTKAVKASGFQMEFQMVNVGGQSMYLPKKISFREAPDFHAPADLKDHPVWNTVNTAIKTITPWGFGAWMTGSIVGGFEHMADKVGNTYNGPVQMQGSYNTAGHDQVVGISQNPTYNATQTEAGGTTGGPDQYGQTSEVDTLAECLTHPPYGYNEHGTPMMTPTESCGSYFGE